MNYHSEDQPDCRHLCCHPHSMVDTMNNSCFIGCKWIVHREGHPNFCTNTDAIKDNGSMLAEHYDCEYCEERPTHRERRDAIQEKLNKYSIKIDQEDYEEAVRRFNRLESLSALTITFSPFLVILILWWIL